MVYNVRLGVTVMALPQRHRMRSAMWYMAPIFLGFIGGLLAYFAVRRDDPSMARRCFIIGLPVTIILLGILVAVGTGSYLEDVADAEIKLPVTDMSPKENNSKPSPAVSTTKVRGDGSPVTTAAVQSDYEQYPKSCVAIEDKYSAEHVTEFVACIATYGADSPECQKTEVGRDVIVDDVPYFVCEYGTCQKTEVGRDVAELQSCADIYRDIVQACQDATAEHFMPVRLQAKQCLERNGWDGDACDQYYAYPSEELSVLLSCMEDHGMKTKLVGALSDFIRAFEAHREAADVVIPRYAQDSFMNIAPFKLGIFESCERANETWRNFYDDLYSVLEPGDYSEMSDEEIYGIMTQQYIEQYGFSASYEDVYNFVESSDRMILAMDDYLTIRGCPP